MRTPALSFVIVLPLTAAGGSVAKDKAALKPHALPPLANPDDPKTPAKELFAQGRADGGAAARGRFLCERLSRRCGGSTRLG
jgi:hypothetical protein